tara:strand:+ start:481 stop:1212 length:732 start_codon:yes stop_codon:yes gene_type:complete
MKKTKTIIITGSEGMIGRSLREYFSKKNFNIIGIDKKKGINSIYCDITDEKSLKKKLSVMLKKKSPDILINAASIVPRIKKFKFSNYSSKNWMNSIKVDLFGSFFISKICCKYFERKKKGLIINLSSIYGDSGPDQSIYGKLKRNYGYKNLEYSVAKAGIIGFTKALSSFYKNSNIKVLCFILGGVQGSKVSKNFKKYYLKKTVENKMITTDQICKYIEFCISNPDTVSGSCINLDGGARSIF